MPSRSDVLKRVAHFNRGRDPERLARKYKAMQKDALGFFRGTCHLFCEDWREAALDDAPAVWVCGDLHVENFGTYKGDNRLVYFDIADFDEALLGACTWDLARLATSLLIAAKVHDVKRKRALGLANILLDSYAFALRDGKARWIERAIARGLIGRALAGLERRTRSAFIAKRTELRSEKLKLRVDGRHTLAIDDAARKRVKSFMRDFAARQPYPKFFKVIDVARRIAGTGSLGLERYTVLIDGTGSRSGRFLLDLKLACPSALAPYVTLRQPRWESEATRIVSIQRRMQAIAPALLQAVTIGSSPYVLRELMPSEDKLDLAAWRGAAPELELLARDLGFLVAWSQLRSSGRDGSSTIDELAAFAIRNKRRRAIGDYAEHYEEIAWSDWKQFRRAYRSGTFRH